MKAVVTPSVNTGAARATDAADNPEPSWESVRAVPVTSAREQINTIRRVRNLPWTTSIPAKRGKEFQHLHTLHSNYRGCFLGCEEGIHACYSSYGGRPWLLKGGLSVLQEPIFERTSFFRGICFEIYDIYGVNIIDLDIFPDVRKM